jgi:hypothetical protein
MGLDDVEFVMQVEDRFGITIRDEEAQTLRTVGDVRDYVVKQLTPRALPRLPQGWCRTQQAFYLLRRLLGPQWARVRPSDRLDLTPRQWAQLSWLLSARAGGRVLPDAQRGWLRWPVGLPQGAQTFGDVARLIAAWERPILWARPPLGFAPVWDRRPRRPGQQPSPVAEWVMAEITQILVAEHRIPVEDIAPEASLVEDLYLGA